MLNYPRMTAAEEEEEVVVCSLSKVQDKVLSLVPTFSAVLSLWGSSNIVCMILSAKKKSPYRRIVLGLSCCDLLNSFVSPWQPLLVPSATSHRIWAIGNDATCSALGFFNQFAFSSVWYSGSLSLYFLLTVRYGVPHRVFAGKYECPLHFMSISFPLVTAITGAAMGAYNEMDVEAGVGLPISQLVVRTLRKAKRNACRVFWHGCLAAFPL